MKSFLIGLSLIGLMTGLCTKSLAADVAGPVMEKNTDAEVLALVDAAAKTDKTTSDKNLKTASAKEEETPLFKNTTEIKKKKSEGGAWLWIRMIGSLGLVLALFVGGLYAFKRMPVGQNVAGRAKMIQVLAQHHIGAKKSLAVIRVAGETVLVGVTDHNISLLKSLSLLDEDTYTAPAKNSNTKFNKTLSQKIAPENSEEFSMKGLKEIIGERLKSMKELS